MANNLSIEKQTAVIHALVEGTSMRAVERITGVHRETIGNLAVRIGGACANLLDQEMRNLNCEHVQVDELHTYVQKKQKRVTKEDREAGKFVGDAWTHVAMDAATKLVPCFRVSKREYSDTVLFLEDLASRMNNRIQLSSDGLDQYAPAVEQVFGSEVDYGQVIKVFHSPTIADQRRYGVAEVAEVRRKIFTGNPGHISTSHVERGNLTIRMHCKRLARLTNAFSKKVENLHAALALHFAYYNYVKVHSSIRCTPAMAAGVSSRLWEVRDLVEMTA